MINNFHECINPIGEANYCSQLPSLALDHHCFIRTKNDHRDPANRIHKRVSTLITLYLLKYSDVITYTRSKHGDLKALRQFTLNLSSLDKFDCRRLNKPTGHKENKFRSMKSDKLPWSMLRTMVDISGRESSMHITLAPRTSLQYNMLWVLRLMNYWRIIQMKRLLLECLR